MKIDEIRLRKETAHDAPSFYNTYTHHFTLFFTEHGGRDVLGTRKIDHLAVFAEVVEMAFPVGADRENVYIVLLDVVNLLSDVVLDNDLIGQSCGFDSFDALKHNGMQPLKAHMDLISLWLK